jgi:hypothetical protein
LRPRLVGVAAFAVQLLTLAALEKWFAVPAGVAVAVAVLAAVSHNFLWHERGNLPGAAARGETLAFFQRFDRRRLGVDESDRDDDSGGGDGSTAAGLERHRRRVASLVNFWVSDRVVFNSDTGAWAARRPHIEHASARAATPRWVASRHPPRTPGFGPANSH